MNTSTVLVTILPLITPIVTHFATNIGKTFMLSSESPALAARAICAGLSLIIAILTVAVGDAGNVNLQDSLTAFVLALTNYIGATGIYHVRANPVR